MKAESRYYLEVSIIIIILTLVLILVFLNLSFNIQQILVALIGLFSIGIFRLIEKDQEIITVDKKIALEERTFLSKNEILKKLPEAENILMSLKSSNRDEVIQTSLNVVINLLSTQTASIFLFSKEGKLERVGIQGLDKKGNIIQNSWLSNESYQPGEGFTGKALYPQANGYGKLQFTNNLSEEELSPEKKKAYLDKLGQLNSAIAIPLNGRNKTYGVLRVINKVDKKTGKILSKSIFSEEEINWLSVIGSLVSNTISNYRKDRQNKLYSDLSSFLAEADHEGLNPNLVYNEVVNRLISRETAFKACILRIRTEENKLKVEAKAGVPDIDWNSRIDQEIQLGEDLPGSAAQRSEPILLKINNITAKQFFINEKWINENQFKSFACFRMIYKNQVLGTLSFYVGYDYEFHSGCRSFLERVSLLVAAFVYRVNKSKKVDKTVDEINRIFQRLAKEQNVTKEFKEEIDEVKRHLDSIFKIEISRENIIKDINIKDFKND